METQKMESDEDLGTFAHATVRYPRQFEPIDWLRGKYPSWPKDYFRTCAGTVLTDDLDVIFKVMQNGAELSPVEQNLVIYRSDSRSMSAGDVVVLQYERGARIHRANYCGWERIA